MYEWDTKCVEVDRINWRNSIGILSIPFKSKCLTTFYISLSLSLFHTLRNSYSFFFMMKYRCYYHILLVLCVFPFFRSSFYSSFILFLRNCTKLLISTFILLCHGSERRIVYIHIPYKTVQSKKFVLTWNFAKPTVRFYGT